jgi:thiamine pyrophosphate-dependent acetolactate synthase large subunit-like protein
MTDTPMLDRRDVVRALLSDRGDLLVVAGLGASAWDITAAGDCANNFPLWGGMGGAAMLGLGLALAQPDRRVLVITGDGEMLMGLGALATIAIRKPANLSIVVLDNEHYSETGGQETATRHGVDLAAIAKGAGIGESRTIHGAQELAPLRQAIQAGGGGPLFAVVKVAPGNHKLVLPPREGAYLTARFREAVLGPAAHHQL